MAVADLGMAGHLVVAGQDSPAAGQDSPVAGQDSPVAGRGRAPVDKAAGYVTVADPLLEVNPI